MTLLSKANSDATSPAQPDSGKHNPLTIFAVLWAILLPLTALTFGPEINPGDVLLAITAVLSIFILAPSNRTMFGHLSAIIIVLALVYFAVALAAGINARDIEESTLNTVKLFVSLASSLIVLVGVARVSGPDAIHRVMMGYAIGSCILAISTWVSQAEVAYRYVGLAGHPVEVGGTLGVAAAYLAFWQTRSKAQLAGKLLGLAVLASGFLRAETLTGPVTVALACLATAIFGTRLHVKRALTSIVAAFAAGWLFISTPTGAELFQKLMGAADPTFGASGDSSLDTRFLTMVAGIERISRHPLAGNGIDQSGMTAIWDLAPHNVLILAWQAGGVLLFLVYALLCVTTFFYVLRLRHTPNDHLLRPLAASAIASWFAAFSGPQLLQRTWLLPILGLIACSAVVAASTRQPDRLPLRHDGLRKLKAQLP
jgi:O-antigen ligase